MSAFSSWSPWFLINVHHLCFTSLQASHRLSLLSRPPPPLPASGWPVLTPVLGRHQLMHSAGVFKWPALGSGGRGVGLFSFKNAFPNLKIGRRLSGRRGLGRRWEAASRAELVLFWQLLRREACLGCLACDQKHFPCLRSAVQPLPCN